MREITVRINIVFEPPDDDQEAPELRVSHNITCGALDIALEAFDGSGLFDDIRETSRDNITLLAYKPYDVTYARRVNEILEIAKDKFAHRLPERP